MTQSDFPEKRRPGQRVEPPPRRDPSTEPLTEPLVDKGPEEVRLPSALRQRLRKLVASLNRELEISRVAGEDIPAARVEQMIGEMPELTLREKAEATPGAAQKEAAGEGPPRWELTLRVAGREQEIHVTVAKPTVVGRADLHSTVRADLDLTDYSATELGMSRQHAILLPAPGGLWLIDLDSTNGTWVNKHFLHPGIKVQLAAGDRLEFGALKLEVGAVEPGRVIVARRRPRRVTARARRGAAAQGTVSCPKCHQEDGQIKNGFTGAGSQRYRCKHCGHRYTPLRSGSAQKEQKRQIAIEMHQEGKSLRAISRELGVSPKTVSTWVRPTT